jgi:hypothetical protein
MPAKQPTASSAEKLTCTPKMLPQELMIDAAKKAVTVNPANRPHPTVLAQFGLTAAEPMRIALVVGKRWPASGVRLTVGFLDNPAADLRKRILQHMNAWGTKANVTFVETKSNPQVRISRSPDAGGGGYWSYVGTDILTIPADEPTMNLQEFTMQTEESEYHRVVRHETGHTLGFPHEHMRKELVDRIDQNKAIDYFGATQGWSPDQVRQQVLTPIDPHTIIASPSADPNSIMCYQIPGFLTKNGQPILGGTDIDAIDFQYAGSWYPKLTIKKPPSKS